MQIQKKERGSSAFEWTLAGELASCAPGLRRSDGLKKAKPPDRPSRAQSSRCAQRCHPAGSGTAKAYCSGRERADFASVSFFTFRARVFPGGRSGKRKRFHGLAGNIRNMICAIAESVQAWTSDGHMRVHTIEDCAKTGGTLGDKKRPPDVHAHQGDRKRNTQPPT